MSQIRIRDLIFQPAIRAASRIADEIATMESAWKFDDPPNAVCFTTTYVLEGSPILHVYHDFDGAWQFHGDQETVPSAAKLVGLTTIVNLDFSLQDLHDLAYGWRADRIDEMSEWRRTKNNAFPSFVENGYYLEDAVWMSQYVPQIQPPAAEIRESLRVGQFVKLIFRFAAEAAEREGGQCERIWVRITRARDDGSYEGTIENEPRHSAAELKDVISFHPLHIADVQNED